MKRLTVAILVAYGLAVLAASAQAASPTRLTLSAPEAVGLGEEIFVEATLVTGDGQAVAGERLEFRQVGVVGERVIAEAATDARGQALFIHREFMVPALTLRVAYAGTPAHGPSQADVQVAVDGIEPQPAVVMSHTPSPLVKATLSLVLGSVWLTYIYAASRVIRVRLDAQKGGRSG